MKAFFKWLKSLFRKEAKIDTERENWYSLVGDNTK